MKLNVNIEEINEKAILRFLQPYLLKLHINNYFLFIFC